MRCRYELDDGNTTSLHPFYTRSNYNPPFANNAIESYIFNTKLDLDNYELPKTYSNLTKQEWHALKNLKRKCHLTIKKADKNSNVIVINTKSYIGEGTKQLFTMRGSINQILTRCYLTH